MNSLVTIILETFWLLVPAAVANSAPVVAAHYHWLPALNQPLDSNLTFRGKRIFGPHKTWRGLITGVAAGAIAGFFLGSAPVGALLGFGALAGDAVKSFAKRQLNIASGKPWPPFDQIDFVIGALVVAWFIFPLTLAHVVVALLVFGIGSYLVSLLGITLRVKKSL